MLNGSYEVGDKVVLLNWDNNNRLLTIKRVYEHKIFESNGEYLYSTFIYLVEEWGWEYWFSKRDIRHATPKEIAQGYRDE